MICLACRRLQNDYYSLITYNNHFNDNLLQRARIIVIYVFLCVFMCFYVFLCVFMCFYVFLCVFMCFYVFLCVLFLISLLVLLDFVILILGNDSNVLKYVHD